MIDVGTLFAVVAPVGVNVRLFVRLIVSPPAAPVGTVISTGDHTVEDVVAFGFRALHVAADPVTAAPQE
jgi:hypothetical protein